MLSTRNFSTIFKKILGKACKIVVLEAIPAFRREIGRAFMDHTMSTDPFLYYCSKSERVHRCPLKFLRRTRTCPPDHCPTNFAVTLL